MARASVWEAATITFLAVTGCESTGSADPNASPGASQRPRQCFSINSARNFRALDSRTVHVRAGRDVYRLDVMGICRDLGWTNRMSLVTSGAGSTVCVGAGLGTSIVTRAPSGQQRCAVQSITALTPEQVQALPARARP